MMPAPDWRTPLCYPSARIRAAALAWMCLRRSSDYRRAWKRLVELRHDSRQAEAFSEGEARFFGIDRLVDPSQDAAPLFLQSSTRITYAEIATSDGGSGGEVWIRFDAKRSTVAQIESVTHWYSRWATQWRSEHRDRMPKRTRKLPSTRGAILALRCHDGDAAGASVSEIGRELFQNSRNLQDRRQARWDADAASKKARRAIKLAIWLIEEGYLDLALKETYRPADNLAGSAKSSV